MTKEQPYNILCFNAYNKQNVKSHLFTLANMY